MIGLVTGHCYLRENLLKPGLLGSSKCDRCKQALEMASHVLCDCEALAVVRFRHQDHHFLQPGNFADIFMSKVLHCIQSVGR
jgi:hypothetical protein